MKKLLTTTIIIVLVLLLIAIIAKDCIAKAIVQKGIRARTGLELVIENVSIGLLRSCAKIDNLVLFNPTGYEDRVMADIPDLFLDFDLGAILKGDIHFEKVSIEISELFVIRDREGRLNLDALKGMGTKKEEKISEVREIREAKSKNPSFKIESFKIDRLELKVGRIIYKDYTAEALLRKIELNLNIDETFKDITDPDQVVKVILASVLKGAAIAELMDVGLDIIKADVEKVLGEDVRKMKEIAEEALGTVSEKLKEKLKKLELFEK